MAVYDGLYCDETKLCHIAVKLISSVSDLIQLPDFMQLPARSNVFNTVTSPRYAMIYRSQKSINLLALTNCVAPEFDRRCMSCLASS